MNGAIAAGHEITARAGARILEEGGNAVDACVAAAFASWIAESPLTGPGAGGFMLVHRARDRTTRLLDFFVAAPGLGTRRSERGGMDAVDIGFVGGDTTQRFLIGRASNAVPGTVAGLATAHASYGTLPWGELLAPAIELARRGIEITGPQALLHDLLDSILRHEGEGRRVYSRPDGGRLVEGDRLVLGDLAATLELIGERGRDAVYRGEIATEIVRHVQEGGGAITHDDLAAYRVVRRRPVSVSFRGDLFTSNPPPSSGGILIAYGLRLLEAMGPPDRARADEIATLVEVMREQTRQRTSAFAAGLYRGGLPSRLLGDDAINGGLRRARAGLAGASELASPAGTTHISVIDGRGNAASLSASTGAGSGVVVPGTGIHLNNMLGEQDLVPGADPGPGVRLTSMMSPSIVLDHGSPRLVLGSAGSARLRAAVLQVVENVVGHGLPVAEAIDRPRVHVDEPEIHCEGGIDPAVLDELERRGYELVRWRRRTLFFGGVAAVERLDDGSLAAAGDPRRGGYGLVVG